MKKSLFLFLFFLCGFQGIVPAAPQVYLTLKDNLFVKIPVPAHGVVCSNMRRVERLSQVLENPTRYETPWGPKVYIGSYKSKPVFIASAPVGSGSGLMFSELYAAGAKYIIRYGSDDVKNPHESEKDLIKIIDETDNLYGFNIQSGVDSTEWGKSVFASKVILDALRAEAAHRGLNTQVRVCHHLENYYGLRQPELFSQERQDRLQKQLDDLKRTDKKESFDMESAVLFRVAKDFQTHAATVLQTVNKENNRLGPYEGHHKTQALEMEKVFIDYVLSALSRIP